jgi:hypothetical protein
MTTTALTPVALPTASRIGQGTAVEQARVIAEVHAAITVAQQLPRDLNRAELGMQRSCAQRSLAERAFFRYSRGGGQITGPSVQLARELARCWGNMQYGLTELRRDDIHGQSEMQAWAWDVETNTRNSTTFIVPHARDTRDGAKALTDMRDIYENNANMGARRLREMIFAILPGWFTEDAIAACYRTLEGDAGEGEQLAERVEQAITGFATLGVTVGQLEQKLGAPASKWVAADLAQLTVVYRSVKRGEATVDDEFPAAAAGNRVTVAEITGPQQEQPAANGKPERKQAKPRPQPTPPAAPAADAPIANAQIGVIGAHGRRLGYEEHEAGEFMNQIAVLAGVPGLADIAALNAEQGETVLDRLGRCKTRPDLVKATTTGELPLEGGE